MGLIGKVTDKIIMRQARAEFEKRGENCEHQAKGVCDKCLKEALGLAKIEAKKLNFTEKIKMLKAARKKE